MTVMVTLTANLMHPARRELEDKQPKLLPLPPFNLYGGSTGSWGSRQSVTGQPPGHRQTAESWRGDQEVQVEVIQHKIQGGGSIT